MGRLDNSDSHADRYSAGRFDHMGCVFLLHLSLPRTIQSDQIPYRYLHTWGVYLIPWVERANKTDAPISQRCIQDGARRRQQLRPRLRLHTGRCQIHQDHVFNVRAILFHHLYYQVFYPAPPPPHLRRQRILQGQDIYRPSGSRSALDLGYGG